MWHRQSRHCPLCGADLVVETIEGRPRPRCSGCHFVLFQNPAGASAGAVVDGAGRVLLVRRALDPHRGQWALPAGYQEADETPAQACEREVREEAGLEVRALELFDLVFVPEDTRKPANVAVYLCEVVGGEARAGDDASEVGWFALDELPAEIAFDNRERVLARLPGDPRYRAIVARAKSAAGSGGPMRYADAGVDIARQDEVLARAKQAIRESFTAGVVGDVGSFGGLFDLGRMGLGEGLLVASADGVGTKLEVAKRARIYDTVGRDLVQHCIDDILVQGARPLFFMDYVASGRLEPEVISGVIAGCAEACRDHGLALLGGETAEMPGMYADGDFDLAGFIVGIVDPDHLIDGSRVRAGQTLLGLPSAGLHTNGYSLARRILFERLGLALDDRPPELEGRTVGEALLAEHRAYHHLLLPLIEERRLAALAHITGGGLVDNLPRVLGAHDAVIDRTSWPVPGLFRLLCEGGPVEPDEAHQAFNMGIGMVLFVDPGDVGAVRERLSAAGEPAYELGEVVAGNGIVRWSGGGGG